MAGIWIAFALSGAAALFAEQVFEKLLSTLVGASTPASAIVLAIYFAGLTAGALAYPKVRRPSWSPLVVYAVLEFTVVLTCGALAWKFGALLPAFAPLLRLGARRPAALACLRGVVAAVWILPLTVPMGATFPTIVDAADRIAIEGPKERAVAVLYATNLLGAIAASLFGPTLVFPIAGLDGGLAVACAFDAIAALLALLTWRRTHSRGAVPSGAPALSGGVLPVPWSLLLFGALTGFLLFGLEVLWTHLTSCTVGTSVYAFSWMLGAVLLGLGVGSAAAALLFRRGRAPTWAPGGALVVGAAILAGSHAAWPSAPKALAEIGSHATTFFTAELARFEIAAALLVPPAAVLGLAYPLLFRTDAFPERGRGAATGRLAAANALGCIAGSLVTGFALLPRFGSDVTGRLLVAVAAALGLFFIGRARGRVTVALRACGAAVLGAALLLPRWDRLQLTSGMHVYFQAAFDPEQTDLLFFHEDTLGGFTTVIQQRGQPTRTLLTNGKFQGNDTGEMIAQTAFALIPSQYLSRFDRALVIGLGTGRTAHVVQELGFHDVDVAELAPGIVAAARDEFRHVNAGVLDQPNVSLLLDDGRNVLLLRDTKYDLITIEITSVWFAGATNLFSHEFYGLAHDRLRERGMLQQWIQFHHIGVAELASVLATVRSVFPVVSVFYVGDQALVVASDGEQRLRPEFLAQLQASGAWRDMQVGSAEEAVRILAGSLFLSPQRVTMVAATPGVIVTTDGNRYLEYATPRYNHVRYDMETPTLSALRRLGGLPF
jgi:spermidine synthase